MADSAVISLMQTIDQVLKSDCFQNPEWTEQLQPVYKTASVFQSFLEHSSQRNIEEVEHFEWKIRNVAYELEDTIEFLVSYAILSESRRSLEQSLRNTTAEAEDAIANFVLNRACSAFMNCEVKKEGWSQITRAVYEAKAHIKSHFPNFRYTKNPNTFLDDFSRCTIKACEPAYRLDHIESLSQKPWPSRGLLERLRLLHTVAQQLTEEIGHIPEKMMGVTHNLKDLSILPASGSKSTMVGFDDQLLNIMDRLTGHPSKLQIIPIVGMGGIGKTTLAKSVYENLLIKEYFHILTWTTVSQEYSFQRTIRGLLGENEGSQRNSEELSEHLYKKLKGRRYLVVIDDIWDKQVWDDVRRILPDDNNGSRIILTSRLAEIGAYADSSSSLHKMRLLDANESWSLLEAKVFAQEHCPPVLERVGREIAEKCRGLPLALVVIGGLLSKGARTKEYWENVAENVNSAITMDDDQCLAILTLSYNNLPSHLKPCFLYMASFPEDYSILVSRLVKLWLAEGFLKSVDSKCSEDIGRQYVKDLVDRNLIMVDRLKPNGGTQTCKIHDVLRDLCMREAHKQFFLYVVNPQANISPLVINGQRRLIVLDALPNIMTKRSFDCLKSVSRCRSFSFNTYRFGIIGNLLLRLPFYLHFRLMRVLELMTVEYFEEFPLDILQLVNLRFLALKCREIPSSISIIWNLQVLKLQKSRAYEVHLPSEIWTMSQLRHINIPGLVFPDPIDRANHLVLENLETLSEVDGSSFTEKIYSRMPNLKKLAIRSPFSLKTIHLRKLERLTCLFRSTNFSETLKVLKLTSTNIPWEEMTVIGSLPFLEVLKLHDDAFKGSAWETNDGEFCRLKYLRLGRMSLKHWRVESSSHFPSLRQLVLQWCHELQEIPSEIGEISTLEVIELDAYCSLSAMISAKKILEDQRDLGNDDLRVYAPDHWSTTG